MNLHVHAPQATERAITAGTCPSPICKGQRSRFLGWFTPWFGWSSTCIRCGERWEDGEMLPRPFAPGWRAKSTRDAKRRWRGRRRAERGLAGRLDTTAGMTIGDGLEIIRGDRDG